MTRYRIEGVGEWDSHDEATQIAALIQMSIAGKGLPNVVLEESVDGGPWEMHSEFGNFGFEPDLVGDIISEVYGRN